MATLAELLSVHEKLTARHRRALEWFLEHEGKLVTWPAPLEDGTLLATKAKGIYKPEWSHYALSVRQTLGGPYPDHDIERLPDGSWQYRYFQEGLDIAAGSENFTNRGLLECMKDAVPVGVLIQRTPKPKGTYFVHGLAFVGGWDAGYFHLAGISSGDTVLDRLQVAPSIAATPSQVADRFAEAFDPRFIDDERRKVTRSVIERRGQAGFRQVLLAAYGSRCVATGYDALDSLEAAHIVPYRGPLTNHPSNGLLLRSDVHSLFDLGMVSIHENEHCMILGKELQLTKYAPLHGARIAVPNEGCYAPSEAALRAHRLWAGL